MISARIVVLIYDILSPKEDGKLFQRFILSPVILSSGMEFRLHDSDCLEDISVPKCVTFLMLR